MIKSMKCSFHSFMLFLARVDWSYFQMYSAAAAWNKAVWMYNQNMHNQRKQEQPCLRDADDINRLRLTPACRPPVTFDSPGALHPCYFRPSGNMHLSKST